MSVLSDIEYLSNNRISTFLQCQKKLEFYIEGVKSDMVTTDTAPRTLGSALHTALEWFFDQSDKSLDKLLELYDDACENATLNWKVFSDGQDILRNWFARSSDIFDRDVISVEERFEVEIGDVPIVAVVDRIDRIDGRTLDVTDYKSGRVPMNRYEIENSLQLGIYNLCARQKYDWADSVRTIYDFLRWDRVSTEMSDSKLDSLRSYLGLMWNRIRSCDEPHARVSGACRWCDYRNMCDSYQNFVENDKFVVPNIDTDNLGGLLDELDMCKDRIKAYKTRKEEIEGWIKSEMVERDIEDFEHGGWVVSLGVQHRTNYDYSTVREILEPLGRMEDVSYVRKGSLDKVLKEMDLTDEQERKLVESSTSSFSRPSLRCKKKRGRKDKRFN